MPIDASNTPNRSEVIKETAHAETPRLSPPDTLWHYTNAGGLQGIFSFGRLRFSNARLMNDQTEFEYGWNLINSVLDEEIARKDRLHDYFFMVKSVANEVIPKNYLFLCSFSETKESISQWQRYGADGHGYCIGIDMRQVTDDVLNANSLALRRMVYKPAEQRDAIKYFVAKARERFEEIFGKRVSREEQERFLHLRGAVLSFQLSELSLALKNPRFEDESEWRFVRVIREDDDDYDPARITFESRGDYVKAYIDYELTSNSTGAAHLPIHAVVCGPRLDQSLSQASVEYLLRLKGYDATVEQSDLRGTWR